ncbi:MAG: preprotein translocase subunit YajC [Clostridia bacterium]
MLNLLLEDAAPQSAGWTSYLMLGVLVLFFVGMMIFSSRGQKKRQKKVADMIDALKVGDKIKTIGGFIGTIIEIGEDNSFIIETGSATMKSYMKIDKSAIYASTDTAAASSGAKPKNEEYNETVKEDEEPKK